MTYSPEYLSPLSAAVGRVIVEWNRIEYVVAELAHRLAGCVYPALIGPAGDVLRIALINMDLRARISTAKAYAFKADAYEGSYVEIDNVLNIVDNELRSERNRFVHSLWHCDFGQPSRVAHGTRIVKPQAGMIELVTASGRSYESIEEVAEFGARLANMYEEIARIEGWISSSEKYRAALANVAEHA